MKVLNEHIFYTKQVDFVFWRIVLQQWFSILKFYFTTGHFLVPVL